MLFIPGLISFTVHLFNNPLVEFISKLIRMYSILAHFSANKHAVKVSLFTWNWVWLWWIQVLPILNLQKHVLTYLVRTKQGQIRTLIQSMSMPRVTVQNILILTFRLNSGKWYFYASILMFNMHNSVSWLWIFFSLSSMDDIGEYWNVSIK